MRCFLFFFFNDTATTEIYTLSLHDALPISSAMSKFPLLNAASTKCWMRALFSSITEYPPWRSEEHTSELQSRQYLVCRLLLEKKKKTSQLTTRRSCLCHVLLGCIASNIR